MNTNDSAVPDKRVHDGCHACQRCTIHSVKQLLIRSSCRYQENSDPNVPERTNFPSIHMPMPPMRPSPDRLRGEWTDPDFVVGSQNSAGRVQEEGGGEQRMRDLTGSVARGPPAPPPALQHRAWQSPRKSWGAHDPAPLPACSHTSPAGLITFRTVSFPRV